MMEIINIYFGQCLPETIKTFLFWSLVAVTSEKREKTKFKKKVNKSSAVINHHCTVNDHGFYTQKGKDWAVQQGEQSWEAGGYLKFFSLKNTKNI